jgi:hypothetical protein
MKRSKIVAGALALAPAAGLLAVTQMAEAHHPEVRAEVVCIDTRAQVTITAWSWVTEEVPRRHNENIAIQWDGAAVANGKFLPSNNHQFSVSFMRPADGRTYTATALAIEPFGANGEFGFDGTFRSVQVKMPKECLPTPTVAPTSTAAPTTTTTAPASTTTVREQVLGVTVTRPVTPEVVAVAVEVLPRFAG